MKAEVKDLLTKSDVTATFSSSNLDTHFAKRFAIRGAWTVGSYSPGIAASGDIDVQNSSFSESSHQLVTGLKVRLTTTGDLPAPLELATDYWVIRTDANTYKLASTLADAEANNPVVLADLGSGNMTVADEAITPVVVADSAITVLTKMMTKTNHGFVSGLPVRVTSSNILPSGFAALTTYYVHVDDVDNFQLSDTLAHALAGTDIIDPVDQGTGNHTFTVQAITDSVVASGKIDTLGNNFDIPAHGFITGVKVQVTTSTTLPSGIVALTNYYTIRINADRIKLASSLADAIAGNALNIAGPGVGNQTITAEAAAATALVEACFVDPNDSGVEWFAVTSSESISGTGSKLWEFVDKAYHSVRVSGTITGGSFTWDAKARVERV